MKIGSKHSEQTKIKISKRLKKEYRSGMRTYHTKNANLIKSKPFVYENKFYKSISEYVKIHDITRKRFYKEIHPYVEYVASIIITT